jgi:uncharacterized delta-60 repeat protein
LGPPSCVTSPTGTLDPTFGSGGQVTIPSFSVAVEVALQADGRLVVAGNSFGAVRLNTDGTFDSSFGSGGVAMGPAGYALAAVLQADGKLIVSGQAGGAGQGTPHVLARFDSDGNLDPLFGTGGVVMTPVDPDLRGPSGIAVRADGSIVTAAWRTDPTAFYGGLTLTRYDGGGNLDTAFGNGGFVTTEMRTYDYHAHPFVLDSEGNLVVGGRIPRSDGLTFPQDLALARYVGDAACGNSVLDVGETCDDGNITGGDCCSATCQLEGCTDIAVTGVKLIVVDKTATGGAAKAVYVSRDAAVTKGAGTDASDIDTRFRITCTAGNHTSEFLLPAGADTGSAGWLTNSATVAKYVNRGAPAGPTGAKVATIKPGFLLRIVGRSAGDVPLDLTAAGGCEFGARTSYLVTNGGTTYRHCTRFDADACRYERISGGTGAKLVCIRGMAGPCP